MIRIKLDISFDPREEGNKECFEKFVDVLKDWNKNGNINNMTGENAPDDKYTFINNINDTLEYVCQHNNTLLTNAIKNKLQRVGCYTVGDILAKDQLLVYYNLLGVHNIGLQTLQVCDQLCCIYGHSGEFATRTIIERAWSEYDAHRNNVTHCNHITSSEFKIDKLWKSIHMTWRRDKQ